MYDGVISRSSKTLVARIPRTESKMKAPLRLPERMEYSIWPFMPLSASEANTCSKYEKRSVLEGSLHASHINEGVNTESLPA